MDNLVWIVGKRIVQTEEAQEDEFIGVFTSLEKAREACVGDLYWVAGPKRINLPSPDRSIPWLYTEWPNEPRGTGIHVKGEWILEPEEIEDYLDGIDWEQEWEQYVEEFYKEEEPNND